MDQVLIDCKQRSVFQLRPVPGTLFLGQICLSGGHNREDTFSACLDRRMLNKRDKSRIGSKSDAVGVGLEIFMDLNGRGTCTSRSTRCVHINRFVCCKI